MKLKIEKAVNKSDKEFVRLVATEDVILSWYILMDLTFDKDGNPSNKHPHTFRFPPLRVVKGDKIIVKSGTEKYSQSPSLNKDYTIHYFSWGIKGDIWNNNGKDRVRLYKLVSAGSKPVEFEE